MQKKANIGQAAQDMISKVTMLASAPRWLTAGRLSQAGTTAEALGPLAGSPDEVQRAIDTGELDLDRLLAGITNEPDDVYTATNELPPELQKFKNLRALPNAPIEAQRVTTKHGDAFKVFDASEALPFKPNLSVEEYGTLAGKLLNRMSERDASGKPQILSADHIMQKPIKNLTGGATLHELRMHGKNRMYIVVQPNTDEGIPRLTILGAHGGDAQTQRDFIDVAAATK